MDGMPLPSVTAHCYKLSVIEKHYHREAHIARIRLETEMNYNNARHNRRR